MPDTTDRTPLRIALTQACEFAVAHGVETPLAPEDFALQRSESGWQHATYVDAYHVISVTIEPSGEAVLRVAELWWIHDQGDDEREACDYCEGAGFDDRPQFRGVPLTDVYLPGDAPAEVTARG
jgi:hypothetical protein